jgi:hypothetical protein
MSLQSLQRNVMTCPRTQPSSGGSKGIRWQVPPQSTQVMESGTGTPQAGTEAYRSTICEARAAICSRSSVGSSTSQSPPNRISS